jgi:phosphatidylserine/phosphatidylglycerophosphate/cardiolipin synthase-like enzyme
VRVYRDREQCVEEGKRNVATTTSILLAAGVQVRVSGRKDLMHLKSYAIDGPVLSTGSANWSPPGLKRRDNDVLYEHSKNVAAEFEIEFDGMRSRAGNANPASGT